MMTIASREQVCRGFLSIGFLSVTIAVVTAFFNPAAGYEHDIYFQTPIIFWLGFGLSIFISIYVALVDYKPFERSLGLGLGLLSFLILVFLPRLRGWYEVLGSDSYSHRGLIISILEEDISLTDFIYPFFHTISVFLHEVTGLELGENFHIIVSFSVLLFVIFVIVTVRSLWSSYWSFPVAMFSAMLLMTVNHVSGHLHFQPSSQAMLLLPITFYLLVRTAISGDKRLSLLLIVSLVGIVLAHPQQAANVLLLLIGFSALQSIHYVITDRPDPGITKSLLPHASILLIVFWIWVQTTAGGVFGRNLVRMVNWLYVDTDTAESVQTRTVSIEALGGSLEEMFMKLFFVSLIFCVVCGFFMIMSLLGLVKGRYPRIQHYASQMRLPNFRKNAVVCYWILGFIVSSSLFFHYLFAGFSDQYFRHHGFIMVTVTILGALAFARLSQVIENQFGRNSATKLVILGCILLLLLAVPAMYPSPYIYQGSDHVTQAELNGHELALNYGDEEFQYSSIRRNQTRYIDAVYGRGPLEDQVVNEYEFKSTNDNFASRSESESGEVKYNEQDLLNHFTRPTYMTVTERNRVDEIGPYGELRWNQDDFEYLHAEPGIHKVVNNGDIEFYLINSSVSD